LEILDDKILTLMDDFKRIGSVRQNHLDFQYSLEHEAKPDVLKLILQTKYGSEGGLRYRHCNMEERIADLHRPDFHVLRQNQQAVGTAVYCKRSFHFEGQTYLGHYIRYFSVAPGMRSQGIGTSLMSNAEKHYRSAVKERAIFYGFIELENIRSMKVSETYKFSSIGQFQTLFFSRLFPRKNPHVQRINKEDKSQFLAKLDSLYKNYSLVNFKRIFHNNNTYIFKKEGEILAGAQVNAVRWIFENIPGFSGWLNMNIIPHLPILGRLVTPDNYRFSSFEGLVCLPGQEAALLSVFEHVLAEHGHYTGMTWLDTRSPLLAGLKEHGKLGLLYKVQKTLPASVVAAFANVPENEQETMRSKPIYISAFDLT
jgi:GNAT superfamily N-acetyltransferase